MNMINKIGTDFELFLTRNNEFYPVVGLIGGTKDNPSPFYDLCNKHGLQGFTYQEDNVMPELNIPAVDNKADWVTYVGEVIISLRDMLPKKYELELNWSPSARFDPKYLESEQASAFGCEPDFNAFTGKLQKPSAEQAGTLRTAGGHIHISFLEGDLLNQCKAAYRQYRKRGKVSIHKYTLLRRAVIALEIAMAEVYLKEPDSERKGLYGVLGSFRPKSYGFELRTPSSFWTQSPVLAGEVYDCVMEKFPLLYNMDFSEEFYAQYFEAWEIRDGDEILSLTKNLLTEV